MLLVTLKITLAITEPEIHTLISGTTEDYFEDKHLCSEILEAVNVAARKLPLEKVDS